MTRLNPIQVAARILIVCVMIFLFFSSCRVSKELHKKTVTETEKSSSIIDSVDTSETKTITVGRVTTIYGDTLTASLSFTDEQIKQMEGFESYATDSIESDGVKVKVTILPFRNGFKTKIQAVAKPKSITNNFTQTKTEQKDVRVNRTATVEKKRDVTQKDLQTKSFPWGIIGLIILALLVWLGLTKYKNFI